MLIALTLLAPTLWGAWSIGCSRATTSSSPKEAVITLFGAMERNDKPAVANTLDLVSLMMTAGHDYALQIDPPRRFQSPTEILADLTDGRTREVWFSMQRVIGAEEIQGDTAYVEVSFISKDSGVQYFNKFGLRKFGEAWRIFAFKTMAEAPKE